MDSIHQRKLGVGFHGRLVHLKKDLRAFGNSRLAAIGPATAAALASYHLVADLVPEEGLDSERLGAVLGEQCRGQRVLLPRAAQGRETLVELLKRVATVDVVIVYEQVEVIDRADRVFDRIRSGEVQVVTLTSPNIASAFLAACDESILDRFRDGTTVLLANSERLREILLEKGLRAEVSPDPTENGLIAGLLALATSRPDRR